VQKGIIGSDVIIDSKSGVSGAGRTVDLAYHFAEANESVSAYGLSGHRHLPEIVQELAAMWPRQLKAGEPARPKVTFTPHLIPMTRGLLSTCYAPLATAAVSSGEGVLELYREFYKGEPFVRVVDLPPATKQASGSNVCLVYPTVDPRTERLIVVSVIDNLVKGAAGQAIQNMNAVLGLPETAGLESPAVYP
jgi:N-acetyl-gamma-glutamyl-phosphate reductase